MRLILKERITRESVALLEQRKFSDLNKSDKKELLALINQFKVQFLNPARQTNPGIDQLQNSVYNYLTSLHDSTEEADILMKDPNKLKGYNEYWVKFKGALSAKATEKGWQYLESTDSPWVQVTKPTTAAYKHGDGNFKFYLTFKRGKEYLQNYSQMLKLLENINDKNTIGKVSFKFHRHFVSGLRHKDNVVIHFKNNADREAVQKSIQESKFILMDRASIGRLDTGVDTDTSDSDVVARNIAASLFQDMKKYATLLNQPENSPQYLQGVEMINDLIERESFNSAHRDSRK